MTPLDAALRYAEQLGWPVFPRPNGRFIKDSHGWQDATVDKEQILAWWREYPAALIAMPTGMLSGVIVLDIDRKGGKDGFASLTALGQPTPETTPFATTPSGGRHFYFRVNAELRIASSHSALGPGLDVLADNYCIALPTPGWRYTWAPYEHPWRNQRGFAELAEAPAWLHIPKPEPPPKPKPIRPARGLSPYADGALTSACDNIRNAPDGQQHVTLAREAFSIGTLAGAGGIPQDWAKRALLNAGLSMTDYPNRHGVWTAKSILRVIDDCFDAGMSHPRPIES